MIGAVASSSTEIYRAVVELSRSIAGRTDLNHTYIGWGLSRRAAIRHDGVHNAVARLSTDRLHCNWTGCGYSRTLDSDTYGMEGFHAADSSQRGRIRGNEFL